MKKQLFKYFIQFTAAMSLCAAMLAGTPSTDAAEPENEISVVETGTGNGSENESGIAPQNDQDPEYNKKL